MLRREWVYKNIGHGWNGKGNYFYSSEVYLLVALAKALKVAPQSGPGQVWIAVFSIYLSLIYYATVC